MIRGEDQRNETTLSYVHPVQLASRVPQDHPRRVVGRITGAAPTALSERLEATYSQPGRHSVPPEHLLRALPRQAFHSVRQCIEQLGNNLRFR
jgi:transposase